MPLNGEALDHTFTPSPPPENPAPEGVAIPAELPGGADPMQIGPTVKIDSDGGVTINLGGPVSRGKREDYGDFNENLAETLSSSAKAMIVEEILQGIESDIASRTQFIDNYTKGIDLLGLKIEEMSNTKSQKRNISRVRHPILLEACVKGQSMARAELMPAEGPCKVMTLSGATADDDEVARRFQQDMNYYLTTVAREYYPDFDRGLFELFFGGNLFKKVYYHPVRRRPVAETINVSDLIVSEDARDLMTALRVTHRTMMAPNLVKRMQSSGAWLDVPLAYAMPSTDPADRKTREAMGISPQIQRPQDAERCIYETTYDIDLGEWGEAEKDQPEGLPIPYVVTIDKDSRQMLAMRRGWIKDDPMFLRRQRYVHYALVPGLGFLAMGYLHLLGNQTRALTAIWRILCDSGMFACFPGGVKSKGLRMSTNEIQPGPGEWVDVDIGPFDRIQDALMPMPYKDPSAVFIQFSEIVGQDAQRLAGSIEMEVGEGRTNIPVGTIMSMIEQQTQVMAAVHKRLHTAQAQELLLLRQEFAENPESLRFLQRNPGTAWEKAEEFMNLNLVPASDPNIPAQTHRIMQATGLVTLASSNPDIYDRLAVHRHAVQTLGIINADRYLHEPTPMPPQNEGGKAPDPLGPAKLQLEIQEAQRKASQELIESQRRQQEIQLRAAADQAAMQSRERIAQMQEETQRLRLATEAQRMRIAEGRANAQAAHDMQIKGVTATRDNLMAANEVENQRTQQGLEAQRTDADRQQTAAQNARDEAQAAHDQEMARRQHALEIAKAHQDGEAQRRQHELEVRKAEHDRQTAQRESAIKAAKVQHDATSAARDHTLEVGRTQMEAAASAREHDLARAKAQHEVSSDQREHARADRLATHEINTPKPKPAGSKPSGGGKK